MRGKQFPPRGPRSNHIKIDVTTEERKQAEAVAAQLGCSVVEAFKASMRIQARRLADHVPAVTREASELETCERGAPFDSHLHCTLVANHGGAHSWARS